MIRAENINKTYNNIPVLRDMSIRVDKGGIFGLAGRSGAGKSTILRLINGLESFDSGSLEVDGVDVSYLSKKDMRRFRKNIGMIFQHFSLLERLNVYDNIALPLRCWKYKSAYIDQKVKSLLDVVGIPEKIMQKPRQLSGGQKQRVAIARALTMDPHILLCDEATSALDPRTADDIIALLKQINKQMGITIIIVTHQMSVLRSICREAAILEHGRIAVSGPVDHVFSQKSSALENLIGSDIEDLWIDVNAKINLNLQNIHEDMFLSQMASELKTDITVTGASVTGKDLSIRISDKSYDDVEKYLNDHDINWSVDEESNVGNKSDSPQQEEFQNVQPAVVHEI